MSAQIIAIASDHAGYELKELLKDEIRQAGYDVHDLGTNHQQSVDYPDYANALAEWMKQNPDNLGVLICGSGIGMSIAANRHKHIRAALVHSGLHAAMARKHNNANVICMGARMLGSDMAKFCLQQFLAAQFEGGRHAARIAKFS